MIAFDIAIRDLHEQAGQTTSITTIPQSFRLLKKHQPAFSIKNAISNLKKDCKEYCRIRHTQKTKKNHLSSAPYAINKWLWGKFTI